MKIIKGGILTAKGFVGNGIACGIKRKNLDLALMASQVPAVTVGVFTKNSVIAAPLIVTKQKIKNNKAIAIIVNSGNANCFTGKTGLSHAQNMAEDVAKLMNFSSDDVLVSSTGIIGKPLPYENIKKAMPKLTDGIRKTADKDIAKAILTTDLVTKECAVQITIGNKKVTIGACAKGSGMIEPNMATMLGFINTDVSINAKLLKPALKEAVEKSFNSITVDGCMSTNDMVTVMANGLAGNKTITKKGKDFTTFCNALNYVCLNLAKKIVRDGEGATKFIEVFVNGAKTATQAKTIAMKIANSNLVKTAAYGSNPNWGRVAAAVGSLGLKISDQDMKITFSSFKKKNIKITVNLNLGKQQKTVYTSDLSLEYVKINGKYN